MIQMIVGIGAVLLVFFNTTLDATTIKLTEQRHRLVVGKHEVIAAIGYAKNLTTQKQTAYRVRILDKFDRELVRRDYHVPFGEFADGLYVNRVQVRPVSGRSGYGVVILADQGAPYTATRTIDLVGIRAGRSTVIRGNEFEVTPILSHFKNQFVLIGTDSAPIQLGSDDEWVAKVWVGSFSLDVPIRIDWYGGIQVVKPVGDYRVSVPHFGPKQALVTVYRRPSRKSPSAFLQVTPTSSVRFIGGFGYPVLREDRVVVRAPALKVEVNGRSGWLLDEAGLAAFGLRAPIMNP